MILAASGAAWGLGGARAGKKNAPWKMIANKGPKRGTKRRDAAVPCVAQTAEDLFTANGLDYLHAHSVACGPPAGGKRRRDDYRQSQQDQTPGKIKRNRVADQNDGLSARHEHRVQHAGEGPDDHS